MSTSIYYTKPSITELEISYATDAATNGWGDKCYDYIDCFEELFKEHLDVKYAIATSSCTGALHLGMSAMGIGPGDEVIMADINWIATAAPIIHLGAKPVFVDILHDTWCIDPSKVEEAITPKTKAIIAVHLYGNLCEMDKLLNIGKRYGLPIIEDSAEAIGSVYHGKRAGSIGAFGSFSFHGTKTLTTGEGGMFVTNDSNLYDKVLTLSNHGRHKLQKKQFWADEVGFKYKMSNVQAAIGCGQMRRINDLIERKRQIYFYYKNKLSHIPNLLINPEKKNTINGAWMPTILFQKNIDNKLSNLIKRFKAKNIDARVFFWPLSMMNMFETNKRNKNSYFIYKRAVNLPSYHDIKENQLDRVIEIVVSFSKDIEDD